MIFLMKGQKMPRSSFNLYASLRLTDLAALETAQRLGSQRRERMVPPIVRRNQT
jgi:hypothetical protein